MNADPDRVQVIDWLRERGFEAEPIPEGEQRLPDIRAVKDGTYLIEVKRRFDEVGTEEIRERQFEDLGYAYSRESLRPSRRYYAHIRDLEEQLAGYREAGALRIGWITCAGTDADEQATFIKVAAYGAGCVADADRTETAEPTGSIFDVVAVRVPGYWCNYLYESCFFSLRNGLDGIVLDVNGSLTLLVNDHSPNADGLRASSLCEFVASIFDPIRRPDADQLYADNEGPRKDVARTLQYLGAKYGFTRPIEIDMQRHSITMRVPRKR